MNRNQKIEQVARMMALRVASDDLGSHEYGIESHLDDNRYALFGQIEKLVSLAFSSDGDELTDDEAEYLGEYMSENFSLDVTLSLQIGNIQMNHKFRFGICPDLNPIHIRFTEDFFATGTKYNPNSDTSYLFKKGEAYLVLETDGGDLEIGIEFPELLPSGRKNTVIFIVPERVVAKKYQHYPTVYNKSRSE